MGLLDNALHALRALRSCDPRNSAMMGRFDTSGYMIPLSVSEISALDGFCDEHVQEWGILAVGCQRECSMTKFKYLNINKY